MKMTDSIDTERYRQKLSLRELVDCIHQVYKFYGLTNTFSGDREGFLQPRLRVAHAGPSPHIPTVAPLLRLMWRMSWSAGSWP